jgi:hypothetical protein
MTDATNDLSKTLASVESIKAYLAGIVRAAADNRVGSPVLLTYVGGEFVKAVGTTFEKHLTALADGELISVPKSRRKLAPFVQTYCNDIFATERTPAGIYTVWPRDPGTNASTRPNLLATPATALRFQRAVWAAFIRPLDGKRRFLNLDQIGFTDATEAPREGNWKEIEEQFILGAPSNAPVDGAELQGRIEDWSRSVDIPLTKLILSVKPAREPSVHLEQLLEVIEALPSALAAQWSVPAAVLKHLRSIR